MGFCFIGSLVHISLFWYTCVLYLIILLFSWNTYWFLKKHLLIYDLRIVNFSYAMNFRHQIILLYSTLFIYSNRRVNNIEVYIDEGNPYPYIILNGYLLFWIICILQEKEAFEQNLIRHHFWLDLKLDIRYYFLWKPPLNT